MPKATLYREEYGEQLIEACRQGYSPTGFAGRLGVSRATVFEWANRHPEFAEAMARAKGARVEWFESQMRNILIEGGTGGQATLLMFLLRNAGPDDYQDRKEITGADGKPLIEDSDPARVAASLLELLKGEGTRVEQNTLEPKRTGRAPLEGGGTSLSSQYRYARATRAAAEAAGEPVPEGLLGTRGRGRPPKQASGGAGHAGFDPLSDPREPPEPDQDEPEPEIPIEEPEVPPAAHNPPPPWGFV